MRSCSWARLPPVSDSRSESCISWLWPEVGGGGVITERRSNEGFRILSRQGYFSLHQWRRRLAPRWSGRSCCRSPGVYGTFAVFKVSDGWWKTDKAARAPAAAEVKSVFQKHADKVIMDTYLLRGLSEKADFFLRVHVREMVHNQNFLLDLMGTALGKHLKNTHTFNGLTKKLNYVPKFSGRTQTELKTPPPQGSPYVIVVPVRKDAEWWITAQDARTAMMKEHTDATVAYLKTVRESCIMPAAWTISILSPILRPPSWTTFKISS